LPFDTIKAEIWKNRRWQIKHNVSGSALSMRLAIRTYASERPKILTRFEQLPKHHKDKHGLQFRELPFTEKEALGVFGKGMDANSANRLLRVLHGRRVAGTLEDPDAPTILNVYETRAKKVALSWLRTHVPVDEVRNYGLRAEKELQEMETAIVEDSQRIGLYRPNSQPIGPGKSVYGESAFDAIRKRNQMAEEAREAAEEAKRKSQADEVRQNTGTLEPMSASRRVELAKPPMNERLKYYIERSKVLPNTPPEMPWYERLWPSTLVVLGVVGLCYVFPSLYTPPMNSQRLFPEIPPSAATVFGLMMANLTVFMLWRIPPAFRMLNKYFITVPGYPRALSLVGNVFSHQSASHFLVNMLVLYFVGIRLHEEVGRANFLSIYLASGVLGSFTSLTSYVLRSHFTTSSLGASGALAGIIAAYLWLNKDKPVGIFGYFLPSDANFSIPSWVPLLGFIGVDIYSLARRSKAPVTMDHLAHLGGYGTGIAAAEALNYRRQQRKKAEMERRKNMGIIDKIKEGRL
jgi:rhomboid-like protein